MWTQKPFDHARSSKLSFGVHIYLSIYLVRCIFILLLLSKTIRIGDNKYHIYCIYKMTGAQNRYIFSENIFIDS